MGNHMLTFIQQANNAKHCSKHSSESLRSFRFGKFCPQCNGFRQRRSSSTSVLIDMRYFRLRA